MGGRRRRAAALLLLPLLAAGAAGGLLAARWRAPADRVRYDPDAPLDPGRTYTLVLWDQRWPTAPDGTDYEAWLQSVLARFRQRHPNIQVRYRLLEPGTGPRELAAALRAGRPPDVYASFPGEPVRHDGRLQVPAYLFFTRDERGGRETPPAYLGAALRLAGGGGREWGWPRLLVAHLWLGARRPLAAAGVDAAAVARAGWTWEETAAALARRGPDAAGLLVNPVGTAAFADLLAARRGAAAAPLWEREGVAEVATWLERLRRAELLAVPAPAEAGDQLLEHALRGRALVVAGLNPWLAALLLHRQRGDDLVLLPVPVPAGQPPALRLEAATVAVFRQHPYRGPDHTRAAVELARHLSAAGHPWALPGTPVLPAWRPAWERWLAAGGFPPGLASLLDPDPAGRPAPAAPAEADATPSGAAAALAAFWDERLPPQELAARAGVAAPPPPVPWWRRWWPLSGRPSG